MIPVAFFIGFAAISMTGMLVSTGSAVKNFHKQATLVERTKTTALASSNIVAEETNSLLETLADSFERSLNASSANYSCPSDRTVTTPDSFDDDSGIVRANRFFSKRIKTINPKKKYRPSTTTVHYDPTRRAYEIHAGLCTLVSAQTSRSENNFRTSTIENFIESIEGMKYGQNSLTEALEFGLDNVDKREEDKVDYEVKFVSSNVMRHWFFNFINKPNPNMRIRAKEPPVLASTVTSEKTSELLYKEGMEDRFLSGPYIKITQDTLYMLAAHHSLYRLLIDRPYDFGLIVDPNGIALSNLPSGIRVSIVDKDENNSPSFQSSGSKENFSQTAIAQLRFASRAYNRAPRPGQPRFAFGI